MTTYIVANMSNPANQYAAYLVNDFSESLKLVEKLNGESGARKYILTVFISEAERAALDAEEVAFLLKDEIKK